MSFFSKVRKRIECLFSPQNLFLLDEMVTIDPNTGLLIEPYLTRSVSLAGLFNSKSL